jgi:hypothetical protein
MRLADRQRDSLPVTDQPSGQSLMRILAVSNVWQGANDYAFVRAFRRAGHSVHVVSDEMFTPAGWKSVSLKVVRRVIAPLTAREYVKALVNAAEALNPHLFFVFKGTNVTPDALRAIQASGAVAINFYPDVSIMTHGRFIPKTLPLYDWIFNTKTFGIGDMACHLGIKNASILPHGFDPEVHRSFELGAQDERRLSAEVSFIGTWSPKKERVIEIILERLPNVRMRVWGNQWHRASPRIAGSAEHREVVGAEYAKCIRATSINLGLLSEVRLGASQGDQITARTFEIPATGGFMLQERTEEAQTFFEEGKECAMFADADELVEKVRYYLAHPEERARIAQAGYRRCITSGYSVDNRAAAVIAKARELIAARDAAPLGNTMESNAP